MSVSIIPDSMPDSPPEYRLLERLGAGTLGELHRARDLRRGRTVALRILDPRIVADAARLEAVLSAAHAARRLSHPSVAAVFESGVEDGCAFIATEYVPGQRLSAIVRGGRLHPARALEIAMHVADALSELHGLDLTYGTLTADCVIVTPRGSAKLLDCGLPVWTRAASEPAGDDVAALGELLFEMLAGRRRRPGWPAEFRIPEVPSAVGSVLQRMTGAADAGRFESMAAAAAAVRDLAVAFGERRRPDAAPVDGRPSESVRGWGRLLLAVLVCVGGAILWWLLTR